ncbi:MAG: hypothetical protein ACRDKS_05405 [Actinomycetota bacterium]
MIDPEKIEVAGAGGAMLVTALFVLRAGAVRVPKADRHTENPTIVGATPPPAAPAAAGARHRRPRILTGEPAAPELRRSGPKRALKLVAGITTLAVGIAVGLIALVRALIALFSRI